MASQGPIPGSGTGRRRKSPVQPLGRTAARTALLTIALPSVAALGVAAAAAGTVNSSTADRSRPIASAPSIPHPRGAEPAAAGLDQQLAGLRTEAAGFADRAGRSQLRLDLVQRQATARERQDAARPRIVLPVAQPGLSATYGMAGTHWQSLHTGIDFPVAPGTKVMAVTDGVVRTEWNPAYGHMTMLTAPDGTETWYCHLSSYRIRRGPVRAGDVIAYSGSSGNSTGPHLHFEVHPHGGDSVDPLPWLLGNHLDPR